MGVPALSFEKLPLSGVRPSGALPPGDIRPSGRELPDHARTLAPRQPLLWAATAFAAGLCAGRYAWRPPSWWFFAALAFVSAALFFLNRRIRLATVLALLAFGFTGAFAMCVGISGDRATGMDSLSDGQEVIVTAHVIAEGNLESSAPGLMRQRLDVETEDLLADGGAHAARFGLRLTIYSKDTAGEVETRRLLAAGAMTLFGYGQRIRFPATLSLPRSFRNAGAFDYSAYLRDQGITASASVKPEEIEVLPGFYGSHAGAWIARMHRSIIARIHQLWPGESGGLIDAMLLGEKSFVERPVRVDFQRAGTYHMLVVAGLHVGILASFVLWILRRTRLGEVAGSGVAMTAILMYALLTREGAPVWRAALMICVYLLTRLLYRKRAAMNALGAAALILLVLRPDALFSASFQMSFLCMGVLAGIAIPLLERTVEPFRQGLRNLGTLRYDRALDPRVAQFRLDVRLVCDRIEFIMPGISTPLIVNALRFLFGVVNLLALSTVMQLGMALPMAWYFHRAASVAVPANLLNIPLLQMMMPAAAVAVGMSYMSLWMARLPAAIAAVALHGIAGSVRWLSGMRSADIRLATPELWVIILVIGGFATAFFFVRAKRQLAIAALTLFVAGNVALWTISPREQIQSGLLEVTAMDVGQGDSILVVFPDGHKLLIDGGGLPYWTHSQMDIGEDVVSPYLWNRGISRLDSIALTHAHADHMDGLKAVIRNFRPRELWLPANIAQNEITTLLDLASEYAMRPNYHQSGDAFAYGGTAVRVLAPDPSFPVRSGHRNDESLVLLVTYGKTSALLEADAEKGTERIVSRSQPRADVLKVAHHGSASGTNADLLAAVRPHYAVISAGVRNVYGHPRREVLGRLQESGAITYRTDIDGATSFFLDGTTTSSRAFVIH